MNASTLLLLLVVLACPLSMAWMMRSGSGHGGHNPGGRDRSKDQQEHGYAKHPPLHERSTVGLHELRDEIDRMIEERERRAEFEELDREPARPGRR